MRALITGASGFIGSRLTRRLVKLGHTADIVARASSNLLQIDDLGSQVRVHLVDEHPDSFIRALTVAKPDVVFHLATHYVRDHQAADLAPMLEANVALPLRLLDAMAHRGVRRFINTGSAWQFYASKSYRPVCLHSATKQAFDALLTYFADSANIDCITLVMHDSYGPGDPRPKIFNVVRAQAGKPEPLAMSGGEQLVDLIHVDDAVDAYIAAMHRISERSTSGQEVFSVSGGQPLPLRRIVEMYMRFAELTIRIDWGARPYHQREVMVPWSCGGQLPGWRPRVDIETGLRELASSFTKSY